MKSSSDFCIYFYVDIVKSLVCFEKLILMSGIL